MDKQSFALESFKNIQELIRFVDQKSNGVLLVSGLILTAFLEFSKGLVFSFSSVSVAGFFTFLFGTTTTGLLIYVIYISIFKILRPQLAKSYSINETSLLYFKHLAEVQDKALLQKQFKDITDDSIIESIADQIFEISRILDVKITELHKSMNYLFCSIASLLTFILISRFI
jgi:hypothetical protein